MAQVARVAAARGMTAEPVRQLVAANTEEPAAGDSGRAAGQRTEAESGSGRGAPIEVYARYTDRGLPESVTGRTDRRLDPDELLRRVQAEERRERRGRLKIFLGYAPRVGKSFRMFDEGRRRKERGQDVVVAAAQSEVRGPVREIVSQLEIIPATGRRDRRGRRSCAGIRRSA